MNEPVQATYTIQLRAVLSGATGDAKSVSWSFLRCSSSQYAIVNDTDGAIECAACTWRHTVIAPSWTLPVACTCRLL